MRGWAYAKINLTLEVLGRRADGYHDLVSVMQTISLADELTFEPGTDLTLDCDAPNLAGPDNLVLKAARLLKATGHFVLRKRIPEGGGLGGGSSDAALALRLIAASGWRLSPDELHAAAAQLGSDVPFFLYGGTCLVEGRGERVQPLSDLPPYWLTLVNPGVPLSTAAVFGDLRPDEYGTGSLTREWLASAARRDALPPPVNSLEPAAARLQAAVGACRSRLIAAGAERVLLSGSGPTVFAIGPNESQARRLAQASGGIAARFVSRDEAQTLS